MIKRRRNSPERILKIAEGSFRMANKKGLLKDFLFYYKLKALNSNGSFLNDHNFYSITSKLTGIPQTTLRRQIKSLLISGFIREDNGSLRLISYDKLWDNLGISLEVNKNKKRLGSFKIFKIESSKVNSLKEIITLNEYSFNKIKQEHKLTSRLKKAINTENNSRRLTVEEQADLCADFTYDRMFSEAKGCSSKINRANADTNISCLGLAILMGYNSAAQGWKLQQSMEDKKLIKIRNRRVAVKFHVSANQFKSSYSHDSSFFRSSNNVLYKQLTNSISIL